MGIDMLKKVVGALAVLALPLAAYATEYRTVERPRQECWNEQVPVQSAGNGYGGAIIGGIAGGILGNQVGGGNGKTIATAVGAVTGALTGDRMASGYPGYRTVQRCRTVIDYQQVPVYREPVQFIPQPVQVIQQPVQIIRQPIQVIQPVPVYVEPDGYYYQRRYWKHHRHEHNDDDDD
jgi:uncharacterized protein YcfJ